MVCLSRTSFRSVTKESVFPPSSRPPNPARPVPRMDSSEAIHQRSLDNRVPHSYPPERVSADTRSEEWSRIRQMNRHPAPRPSDRGNRKPKSTGLVSGHEFTHAANRPHFLKNEERVEAALKSPTPAPPPRKLEARGQKLPFRCQPSKSLSPRTPITSICR